MRLARTACPSSCIVFMVHIVWLVWLMSNISDMQSFDIHAALRPKRLATWHQSWFPTRNPRSRARSLLRRHGLRQRFTVGACVQATNRRGNCSPDREHARSYEGGGCFTPFAVGACVQATHRRVYCNPRSRACSHLRKRGLLQDAASKLPPVHRHLRRVPQPLLQEWQVTKEQRIPRIQVLAVEIHQRTSQRVVRIGSEPAVQHHGQYP